MLTLNVTKLLDGAPNTKLSPRSLYLPGPHDGSDSGKVQATPARYRPRDAIICRSVDGDAARVVNNTL